MTNDPLDNRIQELTWRGKLSAEQEAELRAWLAAHPEAQAEHDVQIALNEILAALPDAPLSSNFTARVMRSLEAEALRGEKPRRGFFAYLPPIHRLLPRAAVVALTIAVALISYEQVRQAHRRQIARAAVVVSEVASIPDPKILEDFDAIRAMSQAPPADEELLKLLQ
ncbi:MAG TPA: hypothetical protein VL361_10985 [Candidatus Limnocylindrales bacterium]|nr:hypothetical protein [Candidatus Limnocylindrales bacterium]